MNRRRARPTGHRFVSRATTGFTLIELLVVVVVIALLAALLIGVLSRARLQSEQSRDLAQLRQLHQAWSLAAVDNNGKAPIPFTRQGASNRSERHWPGRLALYLGLEFPPREYSVFLDYQTLPEETPLRDPSLARPAAGERKTITYAMNHVGIGTHFSGGFVGATTSSGERLDRETRMSDLSSSTIVLANSNPGQWHVGNVLDIAGEPYDPESHGDGETNLRFSFKGKANFIRADGAAFSTDRIPPTEMWVVDGRSMNP